MDEMSLNINSPQVIIITEMRHTGKTTILIPLSDQNNSENKLFLDLEKPLIEKYFEEEKYGKIKKILKFEGLS